MLFLSASSVGLSNAGAVDSLRVSDSYGMPAAPGPGYTGLFVEDDISQIIRPSTLRRFTVPEEGTPLCSSLNDARCSGAKLLIHAILPRCAESVVTDCVQGVAARGTSGVLQLGTFSRNFPDSSPSDFVGDSSVHIPNGSTPSIWNIEGVNHAGGSDYMVLVTVDGSIDVSRKIFSGFYPSLQVALFPVASVAGRFEPWVADSSGVSTTSLDGYGNCAALTRGSCAARQEFPASYSFSVSLRLSATPAGWLSGRIFDPIVKYEKGATDTVLTVEAKPAMVPAVAVWAESSKVPLKMAPACDPNRMCGYALGWNTPNSVDDWRAFYNDSAAWVRGQWSFRNMGGTANGGGTSCFSDESVFHGLVSTNASSFDNGPPVYSENDKTFAYTVGSPHLDEKGVVLAGTYSLVLRDSTAKCLYGAKTASMSATVAVSEGSDGLQSSTIVSVANDGTWLRVNASGFHYSKPDIKVRLTATSVETPTTTVSPATTTTSPLADVSPSTLPTPVPPKLTVKASRSIALTSALSRLRITVPIKAAIVATSATRTVCSILGKSTIKTLKRGTCTVRLVVTPSATKKTPKPKSTRMSFSFSVV